MVEERIINDGRYKVFSDGRIFSNADGEWKEICTTPRKSGYKTFQFYEDGIPKTTYLHRVIAETFIDNPQGLPVVHHKNGDKNNNAVDNLEWTSFGENVRHAWDGSYDEKRDPHRTFAVSAYNNYARLRDAKGLTDYAVCKASGVATSTMSNWKNGRYIPKYEKLSLISEVVGGSISDILGKEGGARAKQEHSGKDHS